MDGQLNPTCLLGVYLISIIGGWLIAGLSVNGLRYLIGWPRDEPFHRVDFMVGGTERLLATTFYLFAPKVLPGFIGAWIAFKLAANWHRRNPANFDRTKLTRDISSEQAITYASFVALIGNVISFAIAIGAGMLIRMENVSTFQG